MQSNSFANIRSNISTAGEWLFDPVNSGGRSDSSLHRFHLRQRARSGGICQMRRIQAQVAWGNCDLFSAITQSEHEEKASRDHHPGNSHLQVACLHKSSLGCETNHRCGRHGQHCSFRSWASQEARWYERSWWCFCRRLLCRISSRSWHRWFRRRWTVGSKDSYPKWRMHVSQVSSFKFDFDLLFGRNTSRYRSDFSVSQRSNVSVQDLRIRLRQQLTLIAHILAKSSILGVVIYLRFPLQIPSLRLGSILYRTKALPDTAWKSIAPAKNFPYLSAVG